MRNSSRQKSYRVAALNGFLGGFDLFSSGTSQGKVHYVNTPGQLQQAFEAIDPPGDTIFCGVPKEPEKDDSAEGWLNSRIEEVVKGL